MNAAAKESGVRIGMRRGGVSAIAPHALVQDRHDETEQSALHGIALALLQFTPEVAIAADGVVLLDVTASLRAFNGRLALCRRIRATVLASGFTPHIGMAPTAQGAWLLARYARDRTSHHQRHQRRVIRMHSLTRRLDALPYGLLPAAAPYHDWLHGIGCRTLADLRKLPRAGLQRRCSPALLQALDRAYGQAPELFEWLQPPPTFKARLELPDRIEHADAVLFAARRLILQMVGWLVARQLAVSRFVLSLEHERGRTAMAPTLIEIALAEPAWQDDHLIRLLKERLGHLQLARPVMAICLEAIHVSEMTPVTEMLFSEPGGTPADYHRLLELLIARLGSENVLLPAPRADYRPEAGNQWMPAATAKRTAASAIGNPLRPFWLLQKPLALLVHDHRPFYGSPLSLVSGPERIECGWWDGELAMRDYFIAQGQDAACYWIYRERAEQDARWFLHGLFA